MEDHGIRTITADQINKAADEVTQKRHILIEYGRIVIRFIPWNKQYLVYWAAKLHTTTTCPEIAALAVQRGVEQGYWKEGGK